ncbi:MAG: cobalt-precorrin 5A hydrolase [Thermodesulfobacteriota bacterium]|nr:cobalt-precorrin 5A hydrolase [Thermodesulfobacteriota bacterium]
MPTVTEEQEIVIDHGEKYTVAIWAITPEGANLGLQIAESLPDADLYVSANLERSNILSNTFKRLSGALPLLFNKYNGHIFIMSTGIVVRIIAHLLRHKTVDPAVVVVDEMGNHSISLVSGHIGGANMLANKVAGLIGADPVITTATDIHRVPSIDTLAVEKGLFIENPDAIKGVNMAFLSGDKIYFHDPFGLLMDSIPKSNLILADGSDGNDPAAFPKINLKKLSGVFICDVRFDLPPQMLILRPESLVAGIGCNRNTSMEEMKSFLHEVLEKFRLSFNSLKCIATINIKKDEHGLLALSEELELPITFYDREELNQIKTIETPSLMVEKYTGVKSVCEAAAILASNNGKLIVPKHSTRNVTIAIARKSFM